MKLWGSWLLAIHALIWTALATAAFATSGPYTTASCWHVVLVYVPPVSVLLVAIGGFSFVILLTSIARPATRTTWSFYVACHGALITAGLFVSAILAYAASGQVNCL
jgi:hypothetical protein